MIYLSSFKCRLKVITCVALLILACINIFQLSPAGHLSRFKFPNLNFSKYQKKEFKTYAWQNVSSVCPTRNIKFHSKLSNLNFTEDLLVNISLTGKHISEITEVPGYFDNLTYFQMKPNPVSNLPGIIKTSCQTICGLDPVEMMIMIMSMPGDSRPRLAIRTTWASPLYSDSWDQNGIVRLAFFIGGAGLTNDEVEAVLKESDQYGDIVVADFQESYSNLSLKLAIALTWTIQNCPHAKYMAKIDTDTFAHVPMLLQFIQNISQHHREFIVGRQHGSAKPRVTRAGRWAVPHDVYPLDVFPKYIYGHSYVISFSAVQRIVKGFPFVSIVPNEDAFVTGIMAKMLNITRLSSKAFAYSLTRYSECDVTYRRYVTAMCRLEVLADIWRSISSRKCSNKIII